MTRYRSIVDMTPFFISFNKTTNSPLRLPQISMNFRYSLANIIECHNSYLLIMTGCFNHDVWVKEVAHNFTYYIYINDQI